MSGAVAFVSWQSSPPEVDHQKVGALRKKHPETDLRELVCQVLLLLSQRLPQSPAGQNDSHILSKL